jgi:predicted type IV restriction endonuclease
VWRLLECNRMHAAACTNGEELEEIVNNRKRRGAKASELADLAKDQGIDEVDAENYVAAIVFIWWGPAAAGL